MQQSSSMVNLESIMDLLFENWDHKHPLGVGILKLVDLIQE